MSVAEWETLARCTSCGRPVDPRDAFLHHEVRGWTTKRAKGAKGGIHGVSRPVYSGRVMCDRCWKDEKRGPAGQETLL